MALIGVGADAGRRVRAPRPGACAVLLSLARILMVPVMMARDVMTGEVLLGRAVCGRRAADGNRCDCSCHCRHAEKGETCAQLAR